MPKPCSLHQQLPWVLKENKQFAHSLHGCIYPKQTQPAYLLATSLPGTEKATKKMGLFANLIFQEGRKGGQQYLGLRPQLHSSLTSILLELQRGKSHGQPWSGQTKGYLQPCTASESSQASPPFWEGGKEPIPPLPLSLAESSSPLTPSWLVDSPAISVRDASKGQVKADPPLLHSLEYGPGWYSPNSELLSAASWGIWAVFSLKLRLSVVIHDPASLWEREDFNERMSKDPSQPNISNNIYKNVGNCKTGTQGQS